MGEGASHAGRAGVGCGPWNKSHAIGNMCYDSAWNELLGIFAICCCDAISQLGGVLNQALTLEKVVEA